MKNLTVLDKKSKTIYNFLYILLTYSRRIVSLILKICRISISVSYLGFIVYNCSVEAGKKCPFKQMEKCYIFLISHRPCTA